MQKSTAMKKRTLKQLQGVGTIPIKIPQAQQKSSENWIESTIEYGRVWIDQATSQWRKIEIDLPSLRENTYGSTLASRGLMGKDKNEESVV